MAYFAYILLLFCGYLLGSIPFGKVFGHIQGVDVQKHGSGNIGFANVQRTLGWRASLPTLACDILKGLLPSWLAVQWFGYGPAFWVGMAAIAGHVFPIWLKFRGGKGVATGFGLILALQPWAAAGGAGVYIAGRVTVKNSALSSLFGIVAVGVVGSFLRPTDWWRYLILLAAALWTLRHNAIGMVLKHDT